jgi:hypothetical protein
MTRNMVMQLTAATLAQQDTTGLESWALRLPAGERRDLALGAVMRARGAAPPSTALLGAFSDDRVRQSALMSTVLATAQADVAAARRLIEAHITDPRLRAQAEQVVDGIARGDPAFPTGVPAMPAGVVRGSGPAFIGTFPPGAVPPGAIGPPLGTNGQPIMIRSPVTGQMVAPGLVPVGPPSANGLPGPPPVAIQEQRQ